MGVVTVLGALPSSRGMLEVRWSGIWFTIPVVAERAVNAQTVCQGGKSVGRGPPLEAGAIRSRMDLMGVSWVTMWRSRLSLGGQVR